jgi:hypothetical protein
MLPYIQEPQERMKILSDPGRCDQFTRPALVSTTPNPKWMIDIHMLSGSAARCGRIQSASARCAIIRRTFPGLKYANVASWKLVHACGWKSRPGRHRSAGSRPRFVVERRRAERGVKSLCGGSNRAGRSVKRTLPPRQTHDAGAEPLMSRRRPCPGSRGRGSAFRVLPGYGGGTCGWSGPE